MQPKEFISKAVKLLIEIDSIDEQLKELKQEAKGSDLDVTTLTAVAKAIAFNKTDELASKSEAILEAIELSRS